MAKDPRFNFFPDNWSGGTRRMSFEQKGAYLELLILNFYCFSDGLPGFTEPEALKVLASAAAYPELWKFLKPKFKQDGNYFFNERLSTEFLKSKKHSELQSDRAKKKWEKEKQDDPTAHATASACNDIGNDTVIVIVDKEVQEEKIVQVLFTTEQQDRFKKFQDWINEHAPDVAKMKQPFTIGQFLSLQKHDGQKVKEVLLAMHNKNKLLKDYKSAYITCTNWIKRTTPEDSKLNHNAGVAARVKQNLGV